MTTTTADDARTAQAEQFSARPFEALVPAMELLSVELGMRRGLYGALRRLGSATVDELAPESGIVERYAREWLEQQAAAGIIAVVEDGDAGTRRYAVPPAHAEVLLDEESPYSMAGAGSFLIGMARAFDAVVADFETGAGVAYRDYGASVRDAISSLNRPAFSLALGEWIRALPEVHERLRSAPSVIVDAGCGTGWSTLALVREYPLARIIGIDLDEASVDDAVAHLSATELGDRVSFVKADAGDADAVRAAVPGPVALFSVLHCLPATIAEGEGEANGTVLRAPTVRRWAAAAGLARFDVLPVDNELWRFYRLAAE